ncbi:MULTISPECIES: ATP-binding response regulator [Proteiniphilum]|jgi:signal transduction histidine kinase/CheY-like chemotaxis protein|uniref:ATP-binding response regulator n=1 Tax=Proteiniphilum TaxID=294702 RepID=UPI001EEB5BFC|nr:MULTISPECIES: hybrid sensor histidine kinase/response regulator [Proteiniphilum]ULB34017.1 response regulator [Proteiniphilum propionicum]
MMKKKGFSKIKLTVIAGYLLVVFIMAIGLLAIYNYLVDFSNKKIKNEDMSELLLVGNVLSKLYEIESEQNLFTAEGAQQYFSKYDSIVPEIHSSLDSLKILARDSYREEELDTIKLLIVKKKENLKTVAVLLDSIGKAPEIIRITESSYVPKKLNREISDYLEDSKIKDRDKSQSDTTVVMKGRRTFLNRVRDVFVPSNDSTLVIENRSVVEENSLSKIVDTLINKVRYSETLDLQRQNQFKKAFLERQEELNHTNRMLTNRIDEMLKGIEQEEIKKSLQLIIDKERALSSSQRTMFFALCLAILIVIIFGILFLVDINRSQRYRKQLEESNKRISELLFSREKLMLTISHDIKAPMSSIIGFIDLMNSGAYRKSSTYLGNMRKSAEHVLQLVSTLLDYHKLESGTWQPKESDFNLYSLVNETVSSFKPLAEQKGLEYIVENCLSVDSECHGDPYVIRQIMGNIISNAVKYTLNGRILIVTGEEVWESAKWLIFSVIDTGIGIDIDEQQLIFGEFQQLDEGADQSGNLDGSGLGLSITKRFVEILKGEIILKSKKGAGSEFIVKIPLKPVLSEKAAAPVEFSERHDLNDISVLAVDDDPIQLKMISGMLENMKVKCISEVNTFNLPSLIQKTKFDLMFLDLQMPGANGFEVIQELRKTKNINIDDIPVIALSARSDLSASDVKGYGFTDFLIKPFTQDQLYRIILRYVTQKNNKKPVFRVESKPEIKKGVGALINFVRTDRKISLEILQSFSDEMVRDLGSLKEFFDRQDYKSAGNLSHKMLPLFRMIGDKQVITLLEQLEREQPIFAGEEEYLFNAIRKSVDEAHVFIRELSENKDDE